MLVPTRITPPDQPDIALPAEPALIVIPRFKSATMTDWGRPSVGQVEGRDLPPVEGSNRSADGNRVSQGPDGRRSEKKLEFGMKSDESFICIL